MHKSQVLFAVLLAFCSGVAAGSFWVLSSQALLVGAGTGVLILGASAYHRTFGSSVQGIRRRKVGFLLGALVLTAILGAYRFNFVFSRQSMLHQFSDREAGGKGVPVTVRGYVDGEVAVSEGTARFPFRVKEVIVPKRVLSVDERILVSANAFPEHNFGDVLTFRGPIRTPRNFDAFDYVTYLKKEGIRSLMSFPDLMPQDQPLVLSMRERTVVALYRGLFSLKRNFEGKLALAIPEPHASYLAGILLGSRQRIPQEVLEAFNRTGMTHVLAISGYNITLIANAVLWLLVFWFSRRNAFWISVVCIVLFTLLTGASASVVRAAIMGLLFLFASGHGRLYDPRNSVVLAGAVMIFFNPFVLVFDVGFQLSFLAVLGLLYVYPLFDRFAARWPNPLGLKDILLMTASAQLLVMPLILYYFQTVSVVSLLANLLILPLIPAAMIFGFLAAVVGFLSVTVAKGVAIAAWALAGYHILVAQSLSRLPFASVTTSLSPMGLFIVYAVVGIGLWFAHRRYAYSA